MNNTSQSVPAVYYPSSFSPREAKPTNMIDVIRQSAEFFTTTAVADENAQGTRQKTEIGKLSNIEIEVMAYLAGSGLHQDNLFSAKGRKRNAQYDSEAIESTSSETLQQLMEMLTPSQQKLVLHFRPQTEEEMQFQFATMSFADKVMKMSYGGVSQNYDPVQLAKSVFDAASYGSLRQRRGLLDVVSQLLTYDSQMETYGDKPQKVPTIAPQAIQLTFPLIVGKYRQQLLEIEADREAGRAAYNQDLATRESALLKAFGKDLRNTLGLIETGINALRTNTIDHKSKSNMLEYIVQGVRDRVLGVGHQVTPAYSQLNL